MNAHGHGFVSYPTSRALRCRQQGECGPVRWEPFSVEGPNRFPEKGPPDGQISSAGVARFAQLDKPKHWMPNELELCVDENNPNLVRQTFVWNFTTAHRSSGFRVFVTNERYNVAVDSLRRDHLNMNDVCKDTFQPKRSPPNPYTQLCSFPLTAFRPGVQQAFLAVWDVDDNYNAFYQIVDFVMRGNATSQSIVAVRDSKTMLNISLYVTIVLKL